MFKYSYLKIMEVLMIYDCFTFFNELDILEIRLNILNDYVDKFVVVEATKTHQGNDKKCLFEENKHRYKKFLDKIIYVKVEDFPSGISQWTIENYQRNAIMRGLANCNYDDIILISDVDEIPNPKLIKINYDSEKIVAFQMRVFNYFLNNYAIGMIWCNGTKMLSYKNLTCLLNDVEYPKTFGIQDDINIGTTPCKIRLYHGDKQCNLRDAGWHFSYIGGMKSCIEKIRSYAEAVDTFSEKDYKKALKSKFYGDFYMVPVKIDSTFPNYLKDNQNKYSKLILKNHLHDINSSSLHRLYRFRYFLDNIFSINFISKSNQTRIKLLILGIKISFVIRKIK